MFVVAYDIADPKRLRRVARCMERHAVRTQKSVFIFRGGIDALRRLLDQVSRLLDPRHDAVQAWPVAQAPARAALARGIAGREQCAAIVVRNSVSLLTSEGT